MLQKVFLVLKSFFVHFPPVSNRGLSSVSKIYSIFASPYIRSHPAKRGKGVSLVNPIEYMCLTTSQTELDLGPLYFGQESDKRQGAVCLRKAGFLICICKLLLGSFFVC